MNRRRAAGEEGLSLVEMVVAISIMATAFLSLTRATVGGMTGLNSARQRSAFLELANAEIESLRALDFASLGVSSSDASNPYTTHDGESAVVLTPAVGIPLAKQIVTTSPVKGITTPYTVYRWVTWSAAAGSNQVKRVVARLEWNESSHGLRHVEVTSLRYPGGVGVTSTNQQPTAVASATPTSGPAPLAVSFSGSGSSDADGSIVSWAWQFGDGATASGVSTSHTYAAIGTYTATLIVTDDGGLTGVSTVTINVVANRAPVASFTATPTGLTVNVDGSASSDPDGTALIYTWNWGDASPNGSGVTASHTYGSGGTRTITLTVSDGSLTGSANASVGVSPCIITAASFTNNGVTNFIVLKSTSKANTANFNFSVTTNTACTGISVSLPTSGSPSITSVTSHTGTTTWTWTKTGVNLGTVIWLRDATQVATVTGTATGSPPVTFAYAFGTTAP